MTRERQLWQWVRARLMWIGVLLGIAAWEFETELFLFVLAWVLGGLLVLWILGREEKV